MYGQDTHFAVMQQAAQICPLHSSHLDSRSGCSRDGHALLAQLCAPMVSQMDRLVASKYSGL